MGPVVADGAVALLTARAVALLTARAVAPALVAEEEGWESKRLELPELIVSALLSLLQPWRR